MEKIKAFHFTDHAVRRSKERGVPLDAMRMVVNYHDTKIQRKRGDHGGLIYELSK